MSHDKRRTLSRPAYLDNLGDCEIRSIRFNHPSVEIVIADPFHKRRYRLTFSDVSYLAMRTDHIQNVIESMHIFDGLEAAMRDESAAKLIQSSIPSAIRDQFKSDLVFYFEPLAGGELFLTCGEWSAAIDNSYDE